MTCGACGARNPAGAAWCSQCFASLAPETTPEPGHRDPALREPAALDPAALDPAGARGVPSFLTGATPARGPTGPSTTGNGVDHPDVRTTPSGVEWCCATCGSWTSIDLFSCSVCGLRMGSGPIDAGGPAVDVSEVTTRAALVPEGGHLMVGRRGLGAAILATVLLWLLGGVLLTLAAVDGGQAPVSGLLLLVGAGGLWAAAARDARTLASGGVRVLLDPRTLVWVVSGVTGLLVISLLVVSLQAAS